MLRTLYHRFQHGSYLKNEHGIKQYAEKCMGQLIRKVTKKSAFYREMDENLLIEKANLRMREQELRENAMLDAGDFFGVRRRLWLEHTIIGAVIVAAIFLNYVAVTAFLTGDSMALGFLRWFVAAAMALVLTGGGLVITERLIENLSPRSRPHSKEISGVEMTTAISILWGILLVGIEVAIMGVSEVRANTLSEETGSSFLYFGFIIASMMLPLVAGALRWDSMRYIDIYKSTRALREIESRLAQIDSVLRQNEEYESNYYKIQSISYWDRLSEFKTYKSNYDEKEGYEETLDDHFARSYDTFQEESFKRYSFDIRDARSPSMRRLELHEDARINRGSQRSLENQPLPTGSNANSEETSDTGKIPEEEEGSDYAGLQPIR